MTSQSNSTRVISPRQMLLRAADVLERDLYEQCSGYLKTREGKFCVSGVLCDLLDENRWSFEEESDSYGYDSPWGNYVEHDAVPSYPIFEQFGLHEGSVPFKHLSDELIAEIKDAIRACDPDIWSIYMRNFTPVRQKATPTVTALNDWGVSFEMFAIMFREIADRMEDDEHDKS